jgi:hypothetical protein
MYDNLREKQYDKSGPVFDDTPAAADTLAAEIRAVAESPLAPKQETSADHEAASYHAVRFCDLNLFRDK